MPVRNQKDTVEEPINKINDAICEIAEGYEIVVIFFGGELDMDFR